MNRFTLIVSIFIGLTVSSRFLLADEVSSLSTIEHFSKLSLIEQKKLLAEKFQKRMEFAENLFYRSEIRTERYQSKNGSVGERIANSLLRRNFAHWQLKDDSRFDIEFFDSNKEEPVMWASACWDSKEGVCRNFVKNEASINRVFGRIDTTFDSAVLPNDTFSFWLQGGSSGTYPQPHYMFLHFLEHQDEWNIVVPFEESKIQISVDFISKIKPSSNTCTNGEITIVIDPAKDYMPIRGSIRGELPLPDGRRPWWKENFTVKESVLKDGIWMPVSLENVAGRASSRDSLPKTFSVKEVKITELEHGNVTQSDVTVTFSEGTEVVDAINGISHKTDANGEPIESTIQPLYGLDPSHIKLPEPPKRKINIVFIIAGILLIATALYILVKTHRKSN
jgi:hypothetical protein